MDTKLNHTHREWTENGEKKEYDFYLKQYADEQLKNMLSQAGFKVISLWGDYDFQEPTKDSRKTLILAEKV